MTRHVAKDGDHAPGGPRRSRGSMPAGGGRLHGGGLPDGVGSGLPESEPAVLASVDDVFDGAGTFLDRHLGIWAPLVEHVYVVGAQQTEAVLDPV